MTETKKGNMFIIGETILWSLFPIISLLGLEGLPGIVSLFWVNFFTMVFFFAIVIYRGKIFELKNKEALFYTLGTVIFINLIFYGLYFFALGKPAPAKAAIVALFEIVPSYIFFQIIRKERFSAKHIIGIFFAVAGALIVLLPKAGGINPGDFIILLAVFFAPLGNWYQQQARKVISTESVLFLRHLIAMPFLFVLAILFKTSVVDYNISHVFWWLLLNGILIFGLSKIFWLEAIHRMSVTKAVAVNGLSPILTVFFAWFLINQSPTSTQIFSLPFLIIAILILTDLNLGKKEALIDQNLQ